MIVGDVAALKGGTGGARIVVIGSGAVGLYVARELARLGHDVVVVESGGTHLGDFAAESYACVGWHHDGIRIGRSRCLGGTTNLWGGQLVEFQPVDFAGRGWLEGSRWPVQYEDIAPYYRRTYENLGIHAEAQDDAVVLRHFLPQSPRFEAGLELFLTRWLKVPSFAVSYAKEIRSSANLRILLDHTAVGFRGSKGVIQAVRLAGPGGAESTLEGEVFILAAGTIEISRLLLHAADATDWDCPWRENPNVGAYFQDHLDGPAGSVHPSDRRRFFDTFCTMVWAGHKYQPKLRLTNEAIESTRLLSVHGTFSFDTSVSENLVYLKQFLKAAIYSRRFSGVGDLIQNLRACRQYLFPLMWKYVVDHRVFVPSGSRISFVIQAEQAPLRESRLTIDRARRDANGMPRVVLDWKPGSEVLSSIQEFTNRAGRALNAAGLAELRIDPALGRLDPSFLKTLHDTNHTSGGARMGASERDGVVDRDLRVFGTKNLYVAGAATFRTSSSANTTFTAMAFATRLIDHLTADRSADLAPAHAAD